MEGNQRWVRMHRDSSLYQVTGLTVRTDLPLGTRIWTGLERTMAEAQRFGLPANEAKLVTDLATNFIGGCVRVGRVGPKCAIAQD